MITDPCKSAKCLKYPICIHIEHMHNVKLCKTLKRFIIDYIIEIRSNDIIHQAERTMCLEPYEARKLYRVITYIFPKIKTITFPLGDTYIQILFSNRVYKLIQTGKPKIVYCSMDHNDTPVIGQSTIQDLAKVDKSIAYISFK